MDIFDVAKACNVSKSTVSRILNNHPYVNEEKEKESYNTLKKIIMFLITLLHILEIELLSQSVFQYLILITPFFLKFHMN